jgi:hypothetical protein
MIRLKGGAVATDPRLGRVPSFDERSRKFPIRALLDRTAKPRSYTWRLGLHLDQGNTPACTGFSTAHELAAKPVVVPHVDQVLAMSLYIRARQNWTNGREEVTTVHPCWVPMKAATEGGYYDEYRWAFGIDDLIMAVGHHGPAILGVRWYTGQMQTDDDGYIHVAGNHEGDHAITATAVNIKKERLWLAQTWGLGWGLNGGCWISFADADRLLHEDGEACIPIKRERGNQ